LNSVFSSDISVLSIFQLSISAISSIVQSLFAIAINLTEKKKFETELDLEIFVRQILKIYLQNKKIKQIIQTKKTDKQKISTIFRKTIKLKLENCTIIEYSIIKIKYLFVRDRIYVFYSNNNIFRVETIRFQYKLLNAEYSDWTTTLEKIQKYYYWFTLYSDIKKYIRNCSICKYSKFYCEYKYNLLKFLSISDRYWQNIFCDFIISLSLYCYKKRLFQHILVIIDRLFKYKKFISINFLKIKIVIQIFIDFVWYSESFSVSIISDRNIQFIVYFWQYLYKKLEIKSKLSTVFYSEIDNQIENINTVFKQYFRAYIYYNQNNWINYLVIAEFVANSYISKSTDILLFFAIKKYFRNLSKYKKCRQNCRKDRDFAKLFSTQTCLNTN